MLHGDGDNEEHGYCPVGQFILQNLGLLLGFAIMLVIALYEDKIVLDIQFWPDAGNHCASNLLLSGFESAMCGCMHTAQRTRGACCLHKDRRFLSA